ncbi:MAG: DUF4230 domain-containing protein [Paludibacteraceae bacterium]
MGRRTPHIPAGLTKSPAFWIILVIGITIYFFTKKAETKHENDTIGETSINISSIKEIAEWEFLTVQCEEFIDTTVKRMIADDRFARIYTGTIRLGMDMKKARKNWIVCRHDTAHIYLPKVEILDKDFIDEAQSRTFYESGKMSATIKNRMYSKAKREMKRRALTKQNIKTAEENAEAQFRYIFSNLGYKVIKIEMKR